MHVEELWKQRILLRNRDDFAWKKEWDKYINENG
jgi:hypothetical protein